MSEPTNIYTEIISSFSDTQLQSVINNAKEYPKLQVEACIKEAEIRAINIVHQIPMADGAFTAYVFKVKNDLSNDLSINECKEYLELEGLSNTQINDIINKSLKKPIPQIESPYKNKEYYGLGLGTFMIAMFLLFRLIKMLMN